MKKVIIAATIVSAATQISTPANAYDRAHLQFGLGASNLFDDNDSFKTDSKELQGGVEWRGKAFSNHSMMGISNISPLAGLTVDSGAGILGYAGLLYDWNLDENWSIVPSLSAGLWSEGDSKDLGGVFNFRTAVEVNYKLDETSRAGLSLAHTSNFGLYNFDPGKEDIMATYSFAY